MRLVNYLAACALAVAATVAASAQAVSFDFDRTTNFASFRTYTWIRGTEVPDEFNNARIVSAVNTQLGMKRLVRVDRVTNADLLVAYHAAFDRDVRITGFADGFGPYRFSRNVSARTEEILTGTLVVDLIDSRTKTIVWRGIASKEIDAKAKPEKRDRNINQAAERLFRNYPPAAR